MRIFIVITGLGRGGAETLVCELVDRFAEQGHQVMLVTLLTIPYAIRPDDERVAVCNLKMTRTPLGVIRALWKMRKLVQGFRPDVVNSHMFHANILVRVLRLFTPMPRLISSAHNTNEGAGWRMVAYRLTDRMADISTNVSQEAVEASEKRRAVRRGRMVPINNGIDTNAFVFDPCARLNVREELRLDDSVPLFMAIGRLAEQKDYPNLIEAFARFSFVCPVARLAIVGDGPLRRGLEAMVGSLGLADRVEFLGIRSDVQLLLSACDVFVMSSAWEGLPMVILEAMACQRPIVATDCGGIRSVLGGKGLVVPPNDSEALGQGMESMFRLAPKERERMGLAARARVVEAYSLDLTVERYLRIYKGRDPKAGPPHGAA